MGTAFGDDIVDVSALIFRFSLYFSLLSGNLEWRPVRSGLRPQPNHSFSRLGMASPRSHERETRGVQTFGLRVLHNHGVVAVTGDDRGGAGPVWHDGPADDPCGELGVPQRDHWPKRGPLERVASALPG